MALVRRAAQRLASLAIVFAPCRIVFAHDHDHCSESLGHHWESPAYLHEIHFQLAMMLLAVCALVALRLLLRSVRREGRRC